ncbi:MAG: hypothetical protein ACRD9Q_01230 [Nitrososphaeraceae archaeon]
MTDYSTGIEEYTNGMLRCSVINDEGKQCNYPIHHSEHVFSLEGIIAPYIWYAENINSMELVREIRDNDC